MVGGRQLQKAIETYSDPATAELWTRISSDAELAIGSTGGASLLRPWDDWHREGMNLAEVTMRMRSSRSPRRASSEVFAEMVPGARVVKAFNHLYPHQLSGDPASEGGRRVLFYSGDDAAAKAEIGALIDRIGFAGIDLGSLAVGGRLVQFPGGPLPALNLVKFD